MGILRARERGRGSHDRTLQNHAVPDDRCDLTPWPRDPESEDVRMFRETDNSTVADETETCGAE